MSISTTTDLTGVEVIDRTWRVNFETPKGGVYSVQAYRQQIHKASDGGIIGKVNTGNVTRDLVDFDGNPTAVMAETVTLADGTVISMAQILEAGSLFGDKWAQEDVSAES